MSKIPIDDIINNFLEYHSTTVTTEWRITSIRSMKNIVFLDIFSKWSKLQVILHNNITSLQLNSGDLISVTWTCDYSKKGEKSIIAISYEKLSTRNGQINYKNILKNKKSVYKAFTQGKYISLNISYSIYNIILNFLSNKGFMNVITPILCETFNWGRSFPVTSHYLNNKLGYNRTTMEERMQALVWLGFESIFQVGSIFRSSKEIVFIEWYSSVLDFNNGIDLLKSLINFVVQEMNKKWFNLNESISKGLSETQRSEFKYIDLLEDFFGKEVKEYFETPEILLKYLYKKDFILKKVHSFEALADNIMNKILPISQSPIIVSNYPTWSSPLYAIDVNDSKQKSLARARIILPYQQGWFDIWIQENNFQLYTKSIIQQRILYWKLCDDIYQSDLDKVISWGLPNMFWFWMNIERFVKLRDTNPSIDPFD